jgi:hypothetical protein
VKVICSILNEDVVLSKTTSLPRRITTSVGESPSPTILRSDSSSELLLTAYCPGQILMRLLRNISACRSACWNVLHGSCVPQKRESLPVDASRIIPGLTSAMHVSVSRHVGTVSGLQTQLYPSEGGKSSTQFWSFRHFEYAHPLKST